MFARSVYSSLSETLRVGAVPSPGTVLSAARPLVAIYGTNDDAKAHAATECLSQMEDLNAPVPQSVCLCCATALVCEADNTKQDSSLLSICSQLCEKLWRTLSEGQTQLDRRNEQVDQNPAAVSMVDCAALCAAQLQRIHPSFLQPMLTGALNGLRTLNRQTSGDVAALPLDGALAFLGQLATLLAAEVSTSTGPQTDCAEVMEQLCKAALDGLIAGTERNLSEWGPLVTRRILLPLLGGQNSAEHLKKLRESFRPAVVSVIQVLGGIDAEGRSTEKAEGRSEALLLLAALFDFLTADGTFTPITETFGFVAASDSDVRRKDFFWQLLVDSLSTEKLLNQGMNLAKIQSLHLQSIYLLKRAVARSEHDLLLANGATDEGYGTGSTTRKWMQLTSDENKEKEKKKNDASPEPEQKKEKKLRGRQKKAAEEAQQNQRKRKSREDTVDEVQVPSNHPGQVYSERFVWSGSGESIREVVRRWETFFRIFDSLGEYSLHLIKPALQQLPVLAQSNLLHPCWIEILLEKAVLHSNTGVRRLSLKGVWSCAYLPRQPNAFTSLSHAFICHSFFASACDPRLITEEDKVVLPGSFLDCKATTGKPLATLPSIQPQADAISAFFIDYLASLTSEEFSMEDACLVMMASTNNKVGYCMLIRCLLNFIRAKGLRFLGPKFLVALKQHLINKIQHQHAHWLEGRILAGWADILLYGMTESGMQEPIFAQVLSMLGKAGSTGGESQSAVDLPLTAGSSGSALAHHHLKQRVLSVSQQCTTVARFLLEQTTLLCNVLEAVLRRDLSHFTGMNLEETISQIKVLTSWIDFTQSNERLQILIQELFVTLGGMQDEPYMALPLRLTWLAFFTEIISHVESDNKTFSLLSAPAYTDGTAKGVWGAVADVALYYLREGAAALKHSGELENQSAEAFSGSQWEAMHSGTWDVLCAATHHILAHAPPSTWIDLDPLKVVNGAYSLVEPMLKLNVQGTKPSGPAASFLKDAGDPPKSEHPKGTTQAYNYEYGRLMVVRNGLRLMDAVLTASIGVAGDELGPHETASDVFTSSSAVSRVSSCFQHFSFETIGSLLCSLLASPRPRLVGGAPDRPCALTSSGWGVVTSEGYRAMWQGIFILARSIEGNVVFGSPVNLDVERFESLLDFVVETVTEELDRCNGSTLSCVFDVAGWALCRRRRKKLTGRAFGAAEKSALAILKGLNDKASEASRRDISRCTATLCFALANVGADQDPDDDLPSLADDMINTLINTHDNPDGADRDMYFVSVALTSKLINAAGGVESDDTTATCNRYMPYLLQLWIFAAGRFETNGGEDELEACLAAIEPVLGSHGDNWQNMRRALLPTIRLASLARSSALAGILITCERFTKKFVGQLAAHILNLTMTNTLLTYTPCMPNGASHRARIRAWQLLCLMSPLFDEAGAWPEVLDHLVWKSVLQPAPGSVRRYIEFLIIRGTLVCPKVGLPLIHKALRDPSAKAAHSGTYALAAIHVIMQFSSGSASGSKEVSGQEVRELLMPEILRLCGCHQHLLRLICHVGFHHLVKTIPGLHDTLSSESQALWNYIEYGTDCKRYREQHFQTVIFDSEEMMTPTQILCVQRKESEQWLQDAVPAATFERLRFSAPELCSILRAISPFEKLRLSHLIAEGKIESSMRTLFDCALLPHSSAYHETFIDYNAELTADEIAEKQRNPSVDADGQEVVNATTRAQDENIQRKVTPWWNTEVHNELHPRALGSNVKQPVIVVTTLLDKPVNVAGLFRCAEIFSVESVVVSDKRVFEHSHFVATARSAELWMPWQAVNEAGLPDFFLQQKQRGYTIVGVEQTADSVMLPEYDFTKSSSSSVCSEDSDSAEAPQGGIVLVLGAEGTGIPASIIPRLDDCVEIPQYGLIRSFNVHVSGAIALYELSRQRRMGKK